MKIIVVLLYVNNMGDEQKFGLVGPPQLFWSQVTVKIRLN